MKKFLLGLILGAAAGSGVTYIFMKKKIDSILTWEEFEECDDDTEFIDPDIDAEEMVLINPQPEVQIHEGARTQEQYTKYHNYAKKNKEEASMSEEERKEAEGERLTKETEELGDRIEIIDADEFGTRPQYDNETLMYYTGDGVLTTEDAEEEIVMDIVGTIGQECIDILEDGEVESVFVRNGRLATEYEVIRVTAAYNE